MRLLTHQTKHAILNATTVAKRIISFWVCEMSKKSFVKMPPAQRAKQFAPFDALAGFDEALREKEREIHRREKKDLSDEEQAHIYHTLARANPGDWIYLSYYEGGEYQTLDGSVDRISQEEKVVIVSGAVIPFAQICAVQVDHRLPCGQTQAPRAKRYVTVNADCLADGRMVPRSILLNKKTYLIDEIVGQENLTGTDLACGKRLLVCYTIRIRSQQTKLYQENSRWFVEMRQSSGTLSRNVT